MMMMITTAVRTCAFSFCEWFRRGPDIYRLALETCHYSWDTDRRGQGPDEYVIWSLFLMGEEDNLDGQHFGR